MGSFVPVAVCSGWMGPQRQMSQSDMWRTLRRVTDELGYNLAQQMEEFQFCACLKWVLKLVLIVMLSVAYGEAQHDVYIRDASCKSEELGDELGAWFGWGLFLRCLSTGWDLFFDVIAFRILGQWVDIDDHEIVPEKLEYTRKEASDPRRGRWQPGQWQPLQQP